MAGDIRNDPHTGATVHIVADRQNRPNLPTQGCPFCVGGLEAPEPYSVRAFPNRWPALDPGYCEVVLYSPHHDATFASIGVDGAADVINLWTERTTALQQLPNGEYVIIFENRGAEIGATINRLTYAADNLSNVSTNTAGSRSRIQDTDYAVAAAELARTQIIQQAGTAMLAQANQAPQSVLALLK